jgi:hypothetical protein
MTSISTTSSPIDHYQILTDAAALLKRDKHGEANQLLRTFRGKISRIQLSAINQIMFENPSSSTSVFLQKQWAQREPSKEIHYNRIRAKALESLSLHFSERELREGVIFPPIRLPSTDSLALMVAPKLHYTDKQPLYITSTLTRELLLASLKVQKEATWKEIKQYAQMGVDIYTAFPALEKITYTDEHLVKQPFTSAMLAKLSFGCPNLKYIDLDWNPNVDDAGLLALAANCPKLQYFRLSSNSYTNPTNVGFIAITRCPLTEFHVPHCWTITNETLIALGKNCPNLAKASFVYSHNINDTGTIPFLEGCRNLTSLSFARFYSITDRTLQAINPKNTPLLKSLELNQCYSVSTDGIAALVARNPQLTELIVYDCGYIAPAALETLAKSHPQCKISWKAR